MRIPAKHPHHSVTLRINQLEILRQRDVPASLALCLSCMAVSGAMGIQDSWEYEELKAAVSAFMSSHYKDKQHDVTHVPTKEHQMNIKFIGDRIKGILNLG